MIYNNELLDWPLDRNVIRRQNEKHTFGMVRIDGKGKPKAHQGWDFHAPVGTPCYAIGNAIVAYVGDRADLGLVVILHLTRMKLYAVYAHLSEAHVTKGQLVDIGKELGLTGITGNAEKMTGEDQHLHFEFRTTLFPGTGLNGRISPLAVFRRYPIKTPYLRERNVDNIR